MDFALDETQHEIAALAATVVHGADPDHGRVSQALASEAGYDEALWKAMAQAGLLSLAVPLTQGGDGFGPLEVAAVLTEVGRTTLPLPALATLALGVLPIVAFGTPDQHALLLTEVAGGAILTAALRPVASSAGSDGPRLTGTVTGVPYAAQAQYILVPCDAGIAVVPPATDGVTVTRGSTSTGAPEYTITFDNALALTALDGDADGLNRFAVAGAAAVADGVIMATLALTAEHLRTREQFGKPLATFQAVAQQIGDVYVAARTIHLAATSVNWRLAVGRDADDDVEIAAYWLASELSTAVQVCHHLHGGLGVDITYPLHRYFSHAKDLGRMVGGAASRLDRIGARCSSN